jgi:ribosome biogenesis GTPase
MTSADSDFNVRRLERYLSMVYEINAQSVIIINKIDKTKDFEKYKIKAEKICIDVPIISISAKEGKSIDEISKYIKNGKTIVLVGSSGVGKSTLINYLLGYSRQMVGEYLLGYSRQMVGETRKSDDKGRHITSARELIVIPNGGMIIDNPGIRELQLWSSGEGISKLFQDIEKISKFCKFKDCTHEHEPGCEVKKAVEEGS